MRHRRPQPKWSPARVRRAMFTGVLVPIVGRAAARPVLLVVTRAAIRALNRGRIEPALRLYAADAVVRQGEGSHRWAGEHRGRPAIAKFLRAMTEAGVQGAVREVWLSGPPWAMRAVVLFDEHALDAAGTRTYENELAFVLRMRWTKIVEHTDLMLSTTRLQAFDDQL